MEKYNLFFIVFIAALTNGQSQNLPKDTLYGSVKKISEKVIFLTEFENPQFLYYDDYGHSGFMGPQSTKSRFHNLWYESHLCYYLNYEIFFNLEKKVSKEFWYGKNGNLINSYRYVYDKKQRLISTIDSTDYSAGTRNHYFNEYGDYVEENIISQDSKVDYFSHLYKKYKNGKVIRTKNFNESGSIDEYINAYNKEGKLTYRIYKNPNKWQKLEGNIYSYGIQDTTLTIYKKLVNEYDQNGKLVKVTTFDMDEGNYSNKIVESGQTTNKYDGSNLIASCSSTTNGNETCYNYEYNTFKQLISKYCCTKNITESKIVIKFQYENNLVSELLYSEESFPTNKMDHYVVTYLYKFDENKNWTEIIKTVDGVKRYKWTRIIEYN